MRVLLVGAGGVGGSIALIAARRDFFELMVVADYDAARAAEVAASTGDGRFVPARVDASDSAAVSALLTEHRCDVLMNATDPRFVMPLFRAALAGGANYLDMAMSLSKPHPTDPYAQTGVKLGDEQFELADDWVGAGQLALVGMGIEPGMADVFARYAADELFSEIEELGVRDGANLVVAGYDFAPSFSIWTTIEECLNPPVIYEKERGWFTTAPFSEPEVFEFPDGIGPVECVNVEHEEVLLMPRWIDAGRVTFKYGLGEEFITVLRVLHKLGLDSTTPVHGRRRRGVTAGRGGGRAAQPRAARRPDERKDLRRPVGQGHREGRRGPSGVPVSRGGQRMVDARVRRPGGGLADRAESGRRPGAAGHRRLVRRRRVGAGGVAAQAVP